MCVQYIVHVPACVTVMPELYKWGFSDNLHSDPCIGRGQVLEDARVFHSRKYDQIPENPG